MHTHVTTLDLCCFTLSEWPDAEPITQRPKGGEQITAETGVQTHDPSDLSSLYHLAMLAPGQYFTCSTVPAGRAGSHSGPAGWWCCRRWRCRWSKGSGRLCLLHAYTHAIRHQHNLHIGWVVVSSERCCGNTGSRQAMSVTHNNVGYTEDCTLSVIVSYSVNLSRTWCLCSCVNEIHSLCGTAIQLNI